VGRHGHQKFNKNRLRLVQQGTQRTYVKEF
jgi:hypothetical protein